MVGDSTAKLDSTGGATMSLRLKDESDSPLLSRSSVQARRAVGVPPAASLGPAEIPPLSFETPVRELENRRAWQAGVSSSSSSSSSSTRTCLPPSSTSSLHSFPSSSSSSSSSVGTSLGASRGFQSRSSFARAGQSAGSYASSSSSFRETPSAPTGYTDISSSLLNPTSSSSSTSSSSQRSSCYTNTSLPNGSERHSSFSGGSSAFKPVSGRTTTPLGPSFSSTSTATPRFLPSAAQALYTPTARTDDPASLRFSIHSEEKAPSSASRPPSATNGDFFQHETYRQRHTKPLNPVLEDEFQDRFSASASVNGREEHSSTERGTNHTKSKRKFGTVLAEKATPNATHSGAGSVESEKEHTSAKRTHKETVTGPSDRVFGYQDTMNSAGKESNKRKEDRDGADEGDRDLVLSHRKRQRENSGSEPNAMVAATESKEVSVYSLKHLQAQMEEQAAAYERERQAQQLSLSNAESTIEKLRRQIRFLDNEEEAMRTELERKDEQFLREKDELRSALRQAQLKIRQLEDELPVPGAVSASPVGGDLRSRMLEDEVRQLREELAASKSSDVDSEKLRAEVTRWKAEATRAREMMEKAQLLADKENADAAARGSMWQREETTALQRKIRKLERELEQASEQAAGRELLTEQVREAQAKAARLEHRLKSMAAVEVKKEVLEAELCRWQQEAARIISASNYDENASTPEPSSLRYWFERMQKEQNVNMRKEVQLKGKITRLDEDLALARREKDEAESKIADLDAEVEELKDQLNNQRKELTFLAKERDSLESLISTYDKELKALQAQGRTDNTLARISEQKESLSRANQFISELKEERRNLVSPAVSDKLKSRIRQLESEISNERDERLKMERQLEKTEAELAKMESRLGRGEYNPAKTKVLHMTINPSSFLKRTEPDDDSTKQLREELKNLQEENDSLKAKLNTDAANNTGILEKSLLSTPGATDNLQLRLQRLKEVFGEKIQKFRECVYLLTGFKVDMSQSADTQLRLRSMYAESEEDSLLFKWSETGLEMLETPFASNLDARIFAYLSTGNSVPAFLASVTLDLFEKQTFMPS